MTLSNEGDFYVCRPKIERQATHEHFQYRKIMMPKTKLNFLKGIEDGFLLVDFDDRTGHNHGTKFRLKQDRLPDLYEQVQVIA